MRVQFDQGTPTPLRHVLVGHSVETAFELGWGTLQNGALIAAAESNGFEVLLTTDKNLEYRQNIARRQLAIVVLSTGHWLEHEDILTVGQRGNIRMQPKF